MKLTELYIEIINESLNDNILNNLSKNAEASLSYHSKNILDRWTGFSGSLFNYEPLNKIILHGSEPEIKHDIMINFRPIKEYLKSNGNTITLYRFQRINTNPEEVPSERLTSWTSNTKFLKHNLHSIDNSGGDGVVLKKDINIDKIVWYTNSMGQNEFIVITSKEDLIGDEAFEHRRLKIGDVFTFSDDVNVRIKTDYKSEDELKKISEQLNKILKNIYVKEGEYYNSIIGYLKSGVRLKLIHEVYDRVIFGELVDGIDGLYNVSIQANDNEKIDLLNSIKTY